MTRIQKEIAEAILEARRWADAVDWSEHEKEAARAALLVVSKELARSLYMPDRERFLAACKGSE